MAPKKQEFTFPEPIANADPIGHRVPLSNFMEAWNNRASYPMHPVWIFAGPKGIGKATIAYNLARYIFKESGIGNRESECRDLFGGSEPPIPDVTPLGPRFPIPETDPVYSKMLSGGFGDFFVINLANNIDKDGKKSTSKIISVHSVRNMIEKMQLSSMEGGWRVVIIDAIDELNVSAQNAILKLLEEPPANTIFFLIAHQIAAALPTIRSRARVEKFAPLSISELRELAARFMPDAEIASEILKLANGSFGKIADLKTAGADALYHDLITLCGRRSADSSDILAIAGRIAKSPENIGMVLDAVAHFGLADLYPLASKELDDLKRLYLEPEIAIFKIIKGIQDSL